MKNDDKASISLKKIICISLIFMLIMTVSVMAGNVTFRNVKIVLASGYEMNVLTSKTNVSEILDEFSRDLFPCMRAHTHMDTHHLQKTTCTQRHTCAHIHTYHSQIHTCICIHRYTHL